MKILSYIVVALALCSCKTQQPCMTSHTFIYEDTVTLHSIHWHYENMEGNKECVYIPEEKIYVIDTIILEMPKAK